MPIRENSKNVKDLISSTDYFAATLVGVHWQFAYSYK